MTWGDLAILAENPKKIKCVVCEMVGELGDLATLVKKRKNVKAFQRKKNVCESQTEGDLGDLATLAKTIFSRSCWRCMCQKEGDLGELEI